MFIVQITFPHDTFGGRDEGMYAGRAVFLATHHTLEIPSYLSTTAMRTDNASNYPPGYIVWLGTQFFLGGSSWMLRSNSIIVVLGLFCLYLVSTLLINKKVGFMSVILYSTCMPFLWFSRETMSENLSFFLLWSLILFLIMFIKTRRFIFLINTFIFCWLFSLTRFEGFVIQFPFLLVVVLFSVIQKCSIKKVLLLISIYGLGLVSTICFLDRSLYQSYFKDTQPVINEMIETDLPLISTTAANERTPSVKLTDKLTTFIIQMISKYNLTIIVYSFVLIVPLLIKDKSMDKNKKLSLLAILFIISPEIFKLVNPRVTLEQPWLYRRYFYALLPAGYIFFSYFSSRMVSKKMLLIMSSCMLFVNFLLSGNIITLKNNWGITPQMEKLFSSITQNDFVIIKDEKMLGYYHPISFLTYKMGVRSETSSNMAYSEFTPKEKIYNGLSYEKLYLLTKTEPRDYKDYKIERVGTIEVNSKQLKPNCEIRPLRDALGIKVHDDTAVPYAEVMEYCKQTENEIVNLKEKVYLFKLDIREN